MLEEVTKRPGDGDIVSWQPHGRAFRVHDPHRFHEKIMSRYFNQTKFKSFQRQLHIYGFHRINSGADKGAYYHKLFVRDHQSLSLRMARNKIKGTSGVIRAAYYVDQEYYSYVRKSQENQVEGSGLALVITLNSPCRTH